MIDDVVFEDRDIRMARFTIVFWIVAGLVAAGALVAHYHSWASLVGAYVVAFVLAPAAGFAHDAGWRRLSRRLRLAGSVPLQIRPRQLG